MTQQRVWWAVESVGFATLGSQTYIAAHGVQSVGVTTTFNLEPVFELGQSAIYENIENIPDVEVTLEKVLDGFPLLYHLATKGSATATLFGRANSRSTLALTIFPDTNDSASGVAIAQVDFSGLYVSNIGYTFPVDGNFTESLTLVGNNKVWKSPANVTFSGGFLNTEIPLALTYSSGGVQRRQDILFDYTGISTVDTNSQINSSASVPCCVLPADVAGISTSGTNELVAGTTNYQCSITNIAVSADLGRDAIYELGHKAPYYRFMTVPVQVNTTIDIINKSGDWVSATEAGVYGNGDNTRKSTIKIATREGTFIDLGTSNRLSNLTIGGSSTGGENGTLSYSFQTYNFMTVLHDQDPTTALAQ